MINNIIIGVAAAILGWFGHILWFNFYRSKYMVSSTKHFTIVNNEQTNILWDEMELWYDNSEETLLNKTVDEDFILLGEDEDD